MHLKNIAHRDYTKLRKIDVIYFILKNILRKKSIKWLKKLTKDLGIKMCCSPRKDMLICHLEKKR